MKRFPRPVLACTTACWAVLVFASPSHGQLIGRLAGSVKTVLGQPIKAATIRAANPSTVPSEFTVTSDQKGEWAILGIRSGLWEVTASAPGFETSTVAVRVGPTMDNPKVQFMLVGEPARGATDGVDTRRLQEMLSAAEALMVQERWDEAVAQYRSILAMVPPLDMVNLAIGRALRMKKDYAGAVDAYNQVLKRDANNQKVLLELGRTQREQGERAAAVATLERVVALGGTTAEAQEARAALDEIRK